MTPHKAPDLTMKPHKATEHQWGIVRRRAKNYFPDSTDSVLLEIADRVAALEEASSELTGTIASADSDIEHRITALESQHNLAVDNITDLQGCANQLKAATSPPPAADHSRGATEMVATDEELCSLFDTRWLQDRSTIAALRAVYNLGRQHAAQVRQGEDPSQLSDGYHTFAELYKHRHALFLALMRAMPQHCWFSSRHADGERCFGGDDWFIAGAELPGGSSVTYHLPADLYLRAKATGASSLDLGRPWDGHTASDVVSRLMEWAAHPGQEGPPSTPSPTHDLTSAAPLLWVLWHHLGASSPVGQPIRRYLGMGQHDRMTSEQMDAATRWARESIPLPAPVTTNPAAIGRFGEWLAREMPPGTEIGQPLHWAPRIVFAVLNACQEVEPTPPPAPAGGLVEKLAIVWSDGRPLHPVACRDALLLVANWLDTKGHRGSAAELRQEVDQGRADG